MVEVDKDDLYKLLLSFKALIALAGKNGVQPGEFIDHQKVIDYFEAYL